MSSPISISQSINSLSFNYSNEEMGNRQRDINVNQLSGFLECNNDHFYKYYIKYS